MRTHLVGIACCVLACSLAGEPAVSAETGPTATPDYSIRAIRYASLPDFPAAALVMGASEDEKTDITMVIWHDDRILRGRA